MGAMEQVELTSTPIVISFSIFVQYIGFQLKFCLFVCLFVRPCFLYLYIYIYAYYFVCVFIIAIIHVCGPMLCAVLSSST